MWRIVFVLILSASVAEAQPTPLTPTPSQTAIQIDNIVNSWAQTLESLQEQNTQLKARVKELEDKYEPKPASKP